MLSSSTSGVGLGEIHFTTYARLMVDPASDAKALVALLDDAKPFCSRSCGRETRAHSK
ncbi:MAG: hypothetical protein AB8H80_22445 [Planctomycetota bacterium]